MKVLRRALHIATATLAAAAAAGPQPAAAQTRCGVKLLPAGPASTLSCHRVRFAPSGRVSVSLRVRLAKPGHATLARVERVAVSVRGRRLVVSRAGRTLLAARAPLRRWLSVRVDTDAARGAVAIVLAGRHASAHAADVHPASRLTLNPRSRAARIARVIVRYAAAHRVQARREPARPFAPTSFWNKPLAADAPLDPRSAAYVADLSHQLSYGEPWINTHAYSTPVYTVGAGQPTVRVTLDTHYAPLQAAWRHVPLPANAQPADGTDGHLVVYQPSRDRMWEFWRLHRVGSRWHARWGGEMEQVSRNPGYYRGKHSGWGATATSLPLLGGLIRVDELRAGHIDHALAMAVPHPARHVFRWPAQRTDGWIDSRTAVPEGMRFRLDPTLDIASLHLPPLVRMLAEAAQRYGIVVRDKSGGVTFYAEDPAPLGANPYAGDNGFFGGDYPNHLLARFPWSRLQALR